MGKTERKEVDMHMHSHYSDGDPSVDDLVRRIVTAGLRGAVLTDHDKIDGVAEFLEKCKAAGVLATTGIEITTTFQFPRNPELYELHILGYGFDLELMRQYEHRLAYNIQSRHEHIKRILELYRRKYGDIFHSSIIIDVFKIPHDPLSNKYWLTKWQAMSIMTDEPYDPKRYRYAYAKAASEIEKKGEFYSPRGTFMSTKEAIQIINVCGGKAVWAHPPLSAPPSAILQEDALKQLREYGLHGVEMSRVYDRNNKFDAEWIMYICPKYNLNANFGGSDYHGDKPDEHKPDDYLGKGGISYEQFQSFLEKL